MLSQVGLREADQRESGLKKGVKQFFGATQLLQLRRHFFCFFFTTPVHGGIRTSRKNKNAPEISSPARFLFFFSF
jgi:hypothetical protein